MTVLGGNRTIPWRFAALVTCALLWAPSAEVSAQSCEDDADCPSDLVCYEQTVMQCSGGSAPACDPSGECPKTVDAGAPECTEKTERSCVPRYVPPCSEDADCGEGFSCEEETIAMCSGGGSTGTGTGGAASSLDGGRATPPDSQTTCTTMPTGTFHCVLQPIECSDDGDCPDGFGCEDDPNQASCAVAGPAAGAGADGSAGGAEDSRCPDAGARQKLCVPPGYDIGGQKGGEQTGSAEHDRDAGSASPPSTPATRAHEDDSGCAVSPGADHGSTTSLALLGLLGIALRARATRRDAKRRGGS